MDMTATEINLIIFTGIHEGLDYYSECFTDYLRKNSIEFYVADVRKPETYLSKEFDAFAMRPNTVMFAFNNVGLNLEVEGENYWRRNGIPVFDYIVDHPRNYDDSMLDPKCDLYVFTLDRDHKDFIDRFYPRVKESFFSPNGGTETIASKEFRQRDIDIIYMGNCNAKSLLPDIIDLEDRGTDFYCFTTEYLVRNTAVSTERAIEAYFDNSDKKISEDKLLEFNIRYAGYIENMVRRHFKLEGMKALDEEGVHVDVFGEGWEDDEYCFSDNITLHGRVDVDTIMELIGRSKISLCFIPWFKKGCSEKNFDSMLNGALCVTDRSEYLETNYKDGYNIIYFDLNNPAQMAADIRWLLENPEAAELIAGRGYETASKYDTWKCRFDSITEIMRSILIKGDKSHNGT